MIIRLKFEPKNPNIVDFADSRPSTLVYVVDPETLEYIKAGTLRQIASWLEAEGFDYLPGTNGLWSTDQATRRPMLKTASDMRR